MTTTDIHNAARVLKRRYTRGIINLAEYLAELYQLASELAFYTIPDNDWFDLVDSWKSPEDEYRFWQAKVEELANLDLE